jgi:hypothetical protein
LFLRNKMNFFTRLRFRSEAEAHLVYIIRLSQAYNGSSHGAVACPEVEKIPS